MTFSRSKQSARAFETGPRDVVSEQENSLVESAFLESTDIVTTKVDNLTALEAAMTTGWMIPTQMSRSIPKGTIMTADFGNPRITVADIEADCSVLGVMSETQSCFGWVLESHSSQILGCDVRRGDFGFFPSGTEYFARHSGRISYAFTTININRLFELARNEGIMLNKHMFSRPRLYRPSPEWAAFSLLYVKQTTKILEEIPELFSTASRNSETCRLHLIGNLARVFLHSLTQSDLATAKTERNHLKFQETVREVQTALENDQVNLLDVQNLCRLAKVPRRSLHRAFQTCMGMPPARYLKLLRMSRAHTELCRSSKENAQVGLVAHKWGFYNAGAFAVEYSDMFGERPLCTLSRRMQSGTK